MNEKNSYEKHLAERFEQLPPPGSASEHWPQMKALLDKDLPEGGGKGPGGFGRWWLYALVGGIIVTATLWFSNIGSTSDSENAPVVSSVNTTAEEKEKQVAIIESNKNTNAETVKNNNATGNSQQTTSASDDATSASTIVNDNSNATNLKTKETKSENVVSTVSPEPQKNASLGKPGNSVATTETNKGKNTLSGVTTSKENKSNIDKKSTLNLVASNSEKKRTVSVKDKKKKELVVSAVVAAGTVQNNNKVVNQRNGKNDKNKKNIQLDLSSNDGSGNANSIFSLASLPDNGSEKAKPTKVRIPVVSFHQQLVGPETAIPDSINADYAFMVNPKPLQLPAPSRFKTETARTRALKNRIVGSGDDKQFVIGLSLPLAFPIGSQENLAFNINAKSNKLSDFLPVPHFQYHLSDKAYLQTELQFIAPQYIQSVLLFQTKKEVVSATNYRFMTSSIYARKLYYFNLPVVAYYSPFKNFYLGTGLQYSKLLSGIALYEDKVATSMQPGANDSLFRSTFKKFRNDSVSNKLAGHDFRFIFDANYYWHRFTVGMRYTQGLSNFVSIQLTNNTPLYTDRNKSLQFYLRYNLWEDMRKKKPALMAWR